MAQYTSTTYSTTSCLELDRQLEQLRLSREQERAAAAARPGPQERLMVRVQGDEAGRTQYVPAGPQITILKRPDQANRERRNEQERSRQPAKTLQQREAEYAEARQRILGSSGVIEKNQGSERSAPVELLRNKQSAQAVCRQPRGPDGTAGFQLRR
ncbi:SUZ domain-containing protein 1-like [Amphibalanus amphitrite]|uniref:SUZ domain-containing protein 1-like n=1 Tax=Amphibalanus amphitrite TaxID=1232801 RepID=UPI001C915568|nr:SUZ domain-containing protein 1-like [Amphibalanus amphitrite]